MIQADIKLLPCNRIWYSPAHNKYYRGTVERLYEGGLADIRCESMELGDHVDFEEIPYGKEKAKHWYFHDISEATKTIMANLGRPLEGIEAVPAYHVRKEGSKEPVIGEEFVEKIVKDKLESLSKPLNEKNGQHDKTNQHSKAHASK